MTLSPAMLALLAKTAVKPIEKPNESLEKPALEPIKSSEVPDRPTDRETTTSEPEQEQEQIPEQVSEQEQTTLASILEAAESDNNILTHNSITVHSPTSICPNCKSLFKQNNHITTVNATWPTYTCLECDCVTSFEPLDFPLPVNLTATPPPIDHSKERDFLSLVSSLSNLTESGEPRETVIRKLVRIFNKDLPNSAIRTKLQLLKIAGVYYRVIESELYQIQVESTIPVTGELTEDAKTRISLTNTKKGEKKESVNAEEKFVAAKVKLGISPLKAREIWNMLQGMKGN